MTAHLFRENSGKMTAVLVRLFGLNQLDMVQDVVQDTFETALAKWRFSGVPDNPSAWLMKVAKNKAINANKREGKLDKLTDSKCLDTMDAGFEHQFDCLISPHEIKDSQLRLLFICCHLDVSVKNQIILTLYILCGFGVPEIANALLMSDEAVKKALTRGKSSLRQLDSVILDKPIGFSAHKTETVMTILYLLFNEGYKSTRGRQAINDELCYEAIRLAKLLDSEDNQRIHETYALLALMFFNISRFDARLGESDEWLTLEEQDRSLWNKVFIEEGYCYLKLATQSEILTRFHIEAIIASIHCASESFAATDWHSIAYLYGQLERIDPSPMITLNKIIAESYLNLADCLESLDKLETHLDFKNNFLVKAAKADICKRGGNLSDARAYYEQALNLTLSPIDKKLLLRRIRQCKTIYN